MQLRATDMEVALRVPLEATVERPGTVVLPARLLLDVVRQLPAGDVSLELRPAEQDVEVVAGTARFHIRTLRAEDFPPLPEPGGDQIVTMPAPAFTETIARVARSASRDETRPILTGILVSAAGDELRMVATDSYRLSVKETHLEASLPDGFEANVPARALEELGRLVRDDVDDIRIGVRANQVVFEVDGLALSSRLIDGQFPNYRQLLPEAYEHELTINREELAGGRAPHQPHGPEERAAAAVLQRGRGEHLGADARRGRGERAGADPVRRRTVRHRLQPGLPHRRPGERRLGGRRAQAHQPAAPGPARVGRRQRLPLPDHADPPERLRPPWW